MIMMEFDFSNLPQNVLVNIQLNLCLTDLKNAVQTCQSWYNASCDPRITKRIRINVGATNSTAFEHLFRPIQNIRLNNVKMNKFKFRKLFQQFGHTIVNVDLLFSTLAFTRIFEIFIYLPHVKTLTIYMVSNYVSSQNFNAFKRLQKNRDTIFKNLRQIENLTIHSRMRNLDVMKLFISHCTNVVKLHWNHSIYLPNNQIDFVCDFLLEPTKNYAITRIHDLLIGCIDPLDNGRFFEKLLSISLPYLKRLYIKEIAKRYYGATFREFCRQYSYLENFTMQSCTEDQLYDICNYMVNLKSLSLEKCCATNLVDIGQLSCLRELHLDRDAVNEDDTLIEMLSIKLPNLVNLTLNTIDELALVMIGQSYPNLENLYLTRVATKKCEPIFRNLTKLKSLTLYFNESATCHSSRIVSSDEWNISRLKNLKVLCVNCWIPGITPSLIQNLSKLDLSCVEGIHDPSYEEFAERDLRVSRRYTYHNRLDDERGVVYELNDFKWFVQQFIL